MVCTYICCAEPSNVCAGMQVDDVGKAEIMLQDDIKDALQKESGIRVGCSPLVHPDVPISVAASQNRYRTGCWP